MKTSVIQSSWMPEYSYRLDCMPYVGGAPEAKLRLRNLKNTVQLISLTKGVDGGIYNGPQFVRNFVESPEYGVRFLTGSSMLFADLSDLPLLSKRDAHSSKLSHLEIQPGMSLISCSGTIGKMAYARTNMKGIWSSQDILKVVADLDKVLPGYLYSFLRSKFGVPLIVAGTYGSIIKHLEPHQIADLPVPRLGDELEQEVHSLVEQAGDALTEYSRLLSHATNRVLELTGIPDVPRHLWIQEQAHLGWSQTGIRSDALRALNYDRRVAKHFEQIRNGRHDQLGNLCEPEGFIGQIIFARIDADEEHGVKLVGQKEAFRVWPEGRTIARSSIDGLGLLVPPKTTLIPSSGTFGEFEVYCRVVYVTKRTSAYAFGGAFYRCVPRPGTIPPGYLFAFLRSDVVFRMLRSISSGDKQQYQHPKLLYEFPIPRLDHSQEAEISKQIDLAASEFDRALDLEERAIKLVEIAIETMSMN